MDSRPAFPRIDPTHWRANGLMFAGLGGGAGTNLYVDASGYDRNGTLTTMDPPTDWVFVPELGRWGLDFDGSNDYSLHGPINIAYGPMFLGAWIKPTTVATYYALFGNDFASMTPGFVFGLGNTSGKLLWYVRTTGGGTYGESQAVCTAGEWQHVGIGANTAGAYTFYRNGVAVGTYANTSNNLGVNAFCLGRRGLIAGQLYAGLESDVVAYNRALSAAEIQGLADPSNVLLDGLIVPERRRVVVWVGEPPSGEEINATLGEVVIAGYPAAILQGTLVEATTGTISITGHAANIIAGTLIEATTGTVSVQGYDATVLTATLIEATLGEVVVTGYPAEIATGAIIEATLGTVTITGHPATIAAATSIEATLGQISVTGHPATISLNTLVEAALGQVTIQGHGATVLAATDIHATLGIVAITGYPATITEGAITFQAAWAAGINTLLGA